MVNAMEKQLIPAGYKQTEVGVIPEDWSVEPLENFTSFISYGFTNPMPTAIDGPPMITARDINSGRILLESARRTTAAAYKALLSPKSTPKINDVLLTKDGTLGRLAIVEQDGICINQSVALLRPNDKVIPIFFKLLLESDFYQTKMLDDAGGSTIKHIYITIVNRMLIHVPTAKEEQTAIADALSDVDALIAALEKLINKKSAIKTAAMQQLLTGKKRLPPFDQTNTGYKQTELGEIPGDWDILTLSNVVKSTQLGGNYGNSEKETNFPLIKMGNLDRGTIKLDKLEFITRIPNELDLLKYGDVLFNTRNTLELVGKVAIWRNELPKAYFNSNLMRFDFNEELVASSFYLNATLNTKQFITSLSGIATGTTSVAAIYTKDLLNLKIVLPKKDEQIAIANALSDMDKDLEVLQQRLHKTQQIKQGMMQELLTGKTRLISGISEP